MIYGYLLVRISCQLEVANFGDGLLAVRYECGAVHRPGARHLAPLTEEQKRAVQLAGAVLCLADALAGRGKEPIPHSLPGAVESSQNRS